MSMQYLYPIVACEPCRDRDVIFLRFRIDQRISIRFGRRVDMLPFDATIININTDRDTALRRVNCKRMTSYHIHTRCSRKTPVLIRGEHKNSPLVKGRQHVGTLFGIVQIFFVKLVLALHDVVNDFGTRQISGRLSACRTFKYLLGTRFLYPGCGGQ